MSQSPVHTPPFGAVMRSRRRQHRRHQRQDDCQRAEGETHWHGPGAISAVESHLLPVAYDVGFLLRRTVLDLASPSRPAGGIAACSRGFVKKCALAAGCRYEHESLHKDHAGGASDRKRPKTATVQRRVKYLPQRCGDHICGLAVRRFLLPAIASNRNLKSRTALLVALTRHGGWRQVGVNRSAVRRLLPHEQSTTPRLASGRCPIHRCRGDVSARAVCCRLWRASGNGRLNGRCQTSTSANKVAPRASYVAIFRQSFAFSEESSNIECPTRRRRCDTHEQAP
jgi:hypothetical protein